MVTEDPRPSSGWRWSDDILMYRIKVVAVMAVAAAVALAAYAAFWR